MSVHPPSAHGKERLFLFHPMAMWQEARSSCVDGMIWGERAQRGVEMAVTWIQGWALLHATLSRGVEAAVVLQAILGLWSLLINQMIRAALSKQMVPKRLHATML